MISFYCEPSILILLKAGDYVTLEILVFYISKLLRPLDILFNNPPWELKELNFVSPNKKLLALIFKFLSDSTIGTFKKLTAFFSSSLTYSGTLKSLLTESCANPNEGFWLSFPPSRNYEIILDVELLAWRGTRSDCTICLFGSIG